MTIIVTGASKGVGLEIVRRLSYEKIRTITISRSITEELKSLANKNRDLVKIIDFDLSETSKIPELFKKKIGFDIEIHGLINNAAIAYDDIVTNADHKRLQAMYQVNTFSPIILTKYAIRHMLLHSIKGSITHISSISAHTGYKGLSMYASTKGALEAFSKNTAREWGPKGIRSNCIVPGFMETAMSSSLDSDQKDRIYRRTSLKKPTSVESVASTCLFLLSEHASSITGQNIHVDCGTI